MLFKRLRTMIWIILPIICMMMLLSSCTKQAVEEPQEVSYLLERTNIVLPFPAGGSPACDEGMKRLWKGEYREALEIFQELVNEVKSAEPLNGLALAQYYLGEYKEAEENLRKALGMNVNDRGEGVLKNNLGVVLAAQRKLDESDKYYEKALLVTDAKEDKLIRLCILVNQADNTASRRGENEAKGTAMLEEALHEAEKMRKKELEIFIDDKIITINYHQIGLETAIKRTIKNQKKIEKAYGEEHPEALFFMESIAIMKMEQEKWGEAKGLFEKVIKGYEKKLSKTHVYLAQVYPSLGICYAHMLDYTAALQCYEKALEINGDIISGPTESYLAYYNIASIYANYGDYEKALEYAMDAYRSILKNNPYDTYLVETILDGLKTLTLLTGVEDSDFDTWLSEQMATEKDIK